MPSVSSARIPPHLAQAGVEGAVHGGGVLLGGGLPRKEQTAAHRLCHDVVVLPQSAPSVFRSSLLIISSSMDRIVQKTGASEELAEHILAPKQQDQSR